MKRGRKNKYDEIIKPKEKEIKKLLKKGTSEKEIAKYLGISYSTWKAHKSKIPYFSAYVSSARSKAIEDIERKMFECALGFTKKVKKAMKVKEVIYKDGKREKEIERIEFYEEEIFFPPSIACMQFLLKNWAKQKYSNNPAELDVKKKEFEFSKKIKEAEIF